MSQTTAMPDEATLIEEARKVVAKYTKHGLVPTPDQVFYVLVAGNVVPRDEQSQEHITNVLSRAASDGHFQLGLREPDEATPMTREMARRVLRGAGEPPEEED